MQPARIYLSAALFVILAGSSSPAATLAEATAQLAGAQAAKDASQVLISARQLIATLGDKAGQASEAPEFILPDEDAKVLEADQVPALFDRTLASIRSDAWWKTTAAGSEAASPLRVVASVVEGCLAARKAGCGPAEELLQEAKNAADYLLAAQKAGGGEVFPFPAWKGKRGRYGMIADKLLRDAETAGKSSDAIHDGWIISDQGSGELNLDNALAGQALLSLYAETKDDRLLAGARSAAKWAQQRPIVPSAHLNAYLVTFLARMTEATGEDSYLSKAVEICRLGIIATQLTEGPNAGRWALSQDARVVYHYQNLRALALLLLAVPETSPDRPALDKALRLGLKAHNQTIIDQGGTALDVTLDVYCLLLSHKDRLGDLLTETLTPDAARMIFRAAVEEFRLEHPTISPGTWGNFLKFTAGK